MLNEKNINVHNPVQINIGPQENSLQTIVRKIKNLDIITTSKYADNFIIQFLKTGLVVVPVLIMVIVLWIFLMAEVALFIGRSDLSFYTRLTMPFIAAHEFFIEKNAIGELFMVIYPILIVWGTLIPCVYIGTFVIGKICYWNDKKNAKALHKLLFYCMTLLIVFEASKKRQSVIKK